MKRTIFALAGLVLFGGAAIAASDGLVGEWQRTDGKSRIRMAPCGDAFCGHVTWLRDANAPAKVGEQVFYALKPSSAGWAGQAYNPEDGKTYSGKVTVVGSSMSTSGCVLGGLICKSVNWSRVK